jgi:hypothetical protein
VKRFYILIFLIVCLSSCKKDKDVIVTGTPADYLSSAVYDCLVVEIVYVEGMRPAQNTINNLGAFLRNLLHKPGGIEFTEKQITSPGKSVYSFEDIRNIEAGNRSLFTEGKTLTAYILFTDGEYAENTANSKILGIAYGASSMAVFEKTIKEYSGGLTQPSETTVETSVTNHEFGHILGLVNNGIKPVSGHQDLAHGKHCDNKDCLMYFATETSDFIKNVLNNQVPVLDDNCVNDLRSLGGR